MNFIPSQKGIKIIFFCNLAVHYFINGLYPLTLSIDKSKEKILDLVNLNKLKEALSGYVKIKIELLKLDITEHLSKVLSRIIALLIVFIMSMFVLAFLSLALANYLNNLWGNSFGGYLVLSGVFTLFLVFIIYLLKSGKLKTFLESNMLNNISEDDS